MTAIPSSNPLVDQLGTTRNTQSRFSEMSSEEFVKIIFTELANQDPFDPNDSAALLEQLNSIRSIESDLEMMQQLESLVHENQLASAGTLIGNFIGGLTEDNNRVAGYVVSVIRQGDTVSLELDNGWVVPIDNVETIIDPSQFDMDDNIDEPDDPDDSSDADESDETDDSDDGGSDEENEEDGEDNG